MIRIERLTKGFGGETLFENAAFTINPKSTAVVRTIPRIAVPSIDAPGQLPYGGVRYP